MSDDHPAVKYGHAPDIIPVRVIWFSGLAGVVFVAATMWAFGVIIPEPRESPEASARDLPTALPLRAQREQLEQEHDVRLVSYGWVDESEGIVHIPIDRAIEILADRRGDAIQDREPQR